MYIATGQRQTTPGDKILMSTGSFVTSFKKLPLKSNFIHFFPEFISVYSPEPGADTLGDEILMPTGTSGHFGHLL